MKRFLSRFFPYLIGYKREFVFVFISIVVVAITTALSAYLVQPILDDIFINKDVDKLQLLPYLIIIVYTLKASGRYIQIYFTNHIGQDIVRKIRDLMLQNLLNLDLEFFNKNRVGELISRITNDINRIQIAVSNYIAEFIRESLTIFALVIVVIYQSPKLAFFGLIVMPLAIYPLSRLARRVKKLSYQSQNKISDLTAKLSEIFHNLEIIKANSAENFEIKKFSSENQKFFEINMKSIKVGELVSPFMEFIGSIAIASVIIMGGMEVIEGNLSVGSFFSFLTALFMLYTPIKRVASIYNKMQDSIAASERIFDLINLKPNIKSGSEKLSEINQIIFKNVNLNYSDKEALKNINLSVKRGEVIALVGDSGGGKSSLINLIVRFYESSNGEIYINNKNIKSYDLKSLRDKISIVTQRVFIFNDTIAKNVAYSDEVDEKRVKEALRLANAIDFIESLPNGIETKLDEFGVNLSGGQRQRIAIARAIYKNPQILILDEATSALDNLSEANIQNNLKEFIGDKIVFIIAHRLNSIKLANRVLFFKDGEIKCSGSEEELMQNCIEFQKLKN